MDCVWDRGAFGSICSTDSERGLYLDIMRPLLRPHFRYLLSVKTFDDSKYKGPPFCNNERKVREIFGNLGQIQKLWEESTSPQTFKKVTGFSIEQKLVIYLMSPN
jgi:hypothetical protein